MKADNFRVCSKMLEFELAGKLKENLNHYFFLHKNGIYLLSSEAHSVDFELTLMRLIAEKLNAQEIGELYYSQEVRHLVIHTRKTSEKHYFVHEQDKNLFEKTTKSGYFRRSRPIEPDLQADIDYWFSLGMEV